MGNETEISALPLNTEAGKGPDLYHTRGVFLGAASRIQCDCAALDEPLVVEETRQTTLLFADPPTALAVTAEGASCALRVRFLRTACPACWLLDVSRLIASRMVFRAQGESPAPGLGKASNLFAASRATSLQRADNVV